MFRFLSQADLRVDLSTLSIPSPQQHSPQPSNVIPIPAHHVVIPPRPSPQLSQEPPSVPSVISPRLSPRAPQDKGNSSKYTFHFPPPITNPFGGSTQGFPTTYQLDSALPAKYGRVFQSRFLMMFLLHQVLMFSMHSSQIDL